MAYFISEIVPKHTVFESLECTKADSRLGNLDT